MRAAGAGYKRLPPLGGNGTGAGQIRGEGAPHPALLGNLRREGTAWVAPADGEDTPTQCTYILRDRMHGVSGT